MNIRDMKEKITEAYKESTPDLSSKIISTCKKESQLSISNNEIDFFIPSATKSNRRKTFNGLIAAAACLLLFVSVFSFGLFKQNEQSEIIPETVVYIDVNPSIELQLDSDNKVICCNAGNEDAQIVLNNINLNEVELNTALNAIVGSMYLNGYLSDESNSMLISVASSSGEGIQDFISDVSNTVNAIFEQAGLQCSIITQALISDDSLKQTAEEIGVSLGKLQLIKKITYGFDNLPFDFINSLINLSISDLNLMYTQGKSDINESGYEIISGNTVINVTTDNAKSIILDKLGRKTEDTEYINTYMKICQHTKSKIVYLVKVKLIDDDTVYKFEVNCQTGEVEEI